MARALLLSLLSRQWVLLKSAGFQDRYPHPWLVWEAGAWNVPEAGEELGTTRLPSRDMADCLPQSDVLCFELEPDAQGGELKLGRAESCTFVVNDATVSREHLRLGFDGERWWIQPFEDAADCTVNGVPLDRNHRTPLVSGMQITAGDARLTFHTQESFYARVASQAERLQQGVSATAG